MTATTVRLRTTPARVHGFDRLVMRLSMATLLWARKRADKAFVSREQHDRLLSQQTHMQASEHDYSKRAARVS